MSPRAPLEMATQFTVERGWSMIPVPYRAKEPILTEWQRLRLSAEMLPQYFNGQPQNLGVLDGEPSRHLADVDVDALEAVKLASTFLPTTPCRWGRASKRNSHWIYTAPIETEKFADPDLLPGEDKKAMLVEIRSTGGQTVAPGSVHPSGEAIEFEEGADGTPAEVDPQELRRTVACLATATILAKHWPAEGSRHDAALAAAGLLVPLGDEELVKKIVAGAARVAGDDEWKARANDVHSTLEKAAAGEPYTAGPRLAELLRGDGGKVVKAIRDWLGLRTVGDLALTEFGNAERFARRHSENLRYVRETKTWIGFDGRCWRADAGEVEVQAAAKDTIRSIREEAAGVKDPMQRLKILAWATKSETEPMVNRMNKLARSEPGIAISVAKLDANPDVLNIQNGTLELRTQHLRPHRREDFCTQIADVEYVEGARHEVLDTYLETNLPDENIRAYVMRAVGYCLTGHAWEEIFFLLYGPGGSGKSTLLEMLVRMLGTYARRADFASFLKKMSGSIREDLARLEGARLVISVETEDGATFAAGDLKKLTGGDGITARHLFKGSREYVPKFKLAMGSNYPPAVDPGDLAFFRRVKPIPFPVERTKAGTGRGEMDASVKQTLLNDQAARSAVLSWALEGAAQWYESGLQEPEEIRKTTEDYRESQKPLAEFIADEGYELGPDLSISAFELGRAYEMWCRARGQEQLKGRAWRRALKLHKLEPDKDHNGDRIWRGIGKKRPKTADAHQQTREAREKAQETSRPRREPWKPGRGAV